MELDPDSDPAWIYLESQHRQITERITAVFESAAYKCQQENDKVHQQPSSSNEQSTAVDIRSCVLSAESPEAESVLGLSYTRIL